MTENPIILAGDVGGTNTRLAFYEVEGSKLRLLDRRDYTKKNYPEYETAGLATIATDFIKKRRLNYACFGMAGPVKQHLADGKKHQKCKMTTLSHWHEVDTKVMAPQLGQGVKAYLINDLESNAYGIEALDPGDFITLQEGESGALGNGAVIAAGTGLGEAGLYWDDQKFIPFACEGGHTDFAPRDEQEIKLLCFLTKAFGHVSYERVLSGPGLLNIFKFLRHEGAMVPPELDKELQATPEDDRPAIISATGMKEKGICQDALNIFVSLYGAEAGNLALKIMARGGVYVGGGIAPKILAKLQEDKRFMNAFLDKGRMGKNLLPNFPVKVIKNPDTALLGAARYANLMANPTKS